MVSLTRKRSSTSSRLKTAECLGIEAILGRLRNPFSRRRLACPEEGQRNRPAVDAAQFAPLVPEGLGRPDDRVIGETEARDRRELLLSPGSYDPLAA
jgi:hypothetical protein